MNISRTTRKKHSELREHKAKTSMVTHLFIAVFECTLHMADICAKFGKIWIVHHFQRNYLNSESVHLVAFSVPKWFLVWLFEKAWEISCQLVRLWDKSWNHEAHNNIVKLWLESYSLSCRVKGRGQSKCTLFYSTLLLWSVYYAW